MESRQFMNSGRFLKIVFSFFYFLCFFIYIQSTYADSGDWIVRKKAQGIIVRTRNVQGSALDECKADCILDAQIETVFNYMTNISTWTDWYAFCKESVLIDSLSDDIKIVYVVIDLPWPFQDRYGIYSAAYTFNENKQNAAISFNSISESEKEKYVTLIENTQYIPIKEAEAKITLHSVGTGKTEIVYEANANPGDEFPAWILNMFSTVQPFKTLKSLKITFMKTD